MQVYRGLGVSEGVAIGKVLKIHSSFVNYPRTQFEDDTQVSAEIIRIENAQEKTEQQLAQISEQSNKLLDEEMTQIFSSYRIMLKDKQFIPQVIKVIEQECINAEWALIRVIATFEEQFSKVSNSYLKARVDDIRQIGEKLMVHLLEQPVLDLSRLSEPVIIICHDISPTDAFHLNKDNILGIATELGGETSHSSILARAMNIPAVVGVHDLTQRLEDDQVCILDGMTGEVIDGPTPELVNEKLDKKEKLDFYQTQLYRLIDQPCRLKDGTQIDLAANLDFIEELPQIREFKIPSIGLVRTEFLFLLEKVFPTEEEQFQLYVKVIQGSACSPVTFRTWDIGADKTSSLIEELLEESNPALGFRGIRTCFEHESMLRTQLRALIRASEEALVKIMIPMVTRIDEVTKVQELINEEKENLGIKGTHLEVGCMLETPAAVLIIDDLLDHCDFISIGTNDLIQYTLAVDRMNEQVATLFDPFHPAILKSLEHVVQTANRRSKPVSICGELASNPIMQMFLFGVGQITLSMSPNKILKTKRILSKVDKVNCKKIAFQFINKHSSDESNRLAQKLYQEYVEEA